MNIGLFGNDIVDVFVLKKSRPPITPKLTIHIYAGFPAATHSPRDPDAGLDGVRDVHHHCIVQGIRNILHIRTEIIHKTRSL